ncbi:MAG: nuclear transport factor 2 family protein [Pseudomonadota bacterium]
MPNSPETLVRRYLDTMEARDLGQAKTMLAPGFEMVFPGGVRFTELEALVAWSKVRYANISKTFTRFESTPTTVYCIGTLSGGWPDGTPFQGIRFIDRFEHADGLLTRQEVWNDMAEHRT